VTGLYFDVLQSQLEIQILKTRLAYLNKHLDILQIMWKAGTIQKLDILQTQSIINKLREDIMQKELISDQLNNTISRIMGFSSADGFTVDTLSMVLPSPGIIDMVPRTWIENHPQVLGFQNKYEKELLMKKEVQAAYLPHIQMISGFTLDGDPTSEGNYSLLAIGATIPVFSWEKKEYELGEIDYAANAIQAQKKNAERNLFTSYDQVTTQIKQINKIIEFQESKLRNDMEAANLSESNYLSGIATNLDYLSAQEKLTETRLNINTLRYQYLKSVIAFWLLTGQEDKIKNIK
jgi:outer membrane protein TolC